MPFDPAKHIIRVQGNREYLPVAPRLIWFRELHPDWGVETAFDHLDMEKLVAVVTVTVKDDQGRIRAQATKAETAKGFADFVEKAQTGALGRALAMIGVGTQFAMDDMDEGQRLADSPQPARSAPPQQPARQAPGAPATGNGRPEGCTCPPACKTHQAANPKCALNAKMESGE